MKSIEEIKKHFEQNMLDGDRLEDCGRTMLSAEHVWEYFKEALAAQREELLKEAQFELISTSRLALTSGQTAILRNALEKLAKLKEEKEARG